MFAVLNYFVDYLCSEKSKGRSNAYFLTLNNYRMYQSRKEEDVFSSYFESTLNSGEITEFDEEVVVPTNCRKTIAPLGLMTKTGRANARELLPPQEENRALIGEVIDQYFQLNIRLRGIVNDFYHQELFGTPVIGIHIRGAGGLDGGAGKHRFQYELEDGIPFAPYFERIYCFLKKEPTGKILVCSDSGSVVERMKLEYGNKIVRYDSQLTHFGESHIACQRARELGEECLLNPRVMGEDVIVEAWLLSKCDFFVHGNSNISNFIICLNPVLKHQDIYEEFYSYNFSGIELFLAKLHSGFFFHYSLIRRILGKIIPKWGCPE